MALYLDLVSKMDNVIKKDVVVENPLEMLFEMTGETISLFYEYRFLMLDFVYITRNHVMIRNHYQKLMGARQQQFEGLLTRLIDTKLIREEIIDNEYKYLFRKLRIVGDFWLAATYIDKNCATSKKDIPDGTRLLKQIIFPYLTAQGRTVFLE